jgi:hypothetical protein
MKRVSSPAFTCRHSQFRFEKRTASRCVAFEPGLRRPEQREELLEKLGLAVDQQLKMAPSANERFVEDLDRDLIGILVIP